jgi:hypothetical protein
MLDAHHLYLPSNFGECGVVDAILFFAHKGLAAQLEYYPLVPGLSHTILPAGLMTG